MAEYRLKYEFAHLFQTASGGFTSTYPGLTATGTTSDGAIIYDLSEFIEEPDKVSFSFGELDIDGANLINSTGIEKGVSSKMTIFGEGAAYVRQWLITHPQASVNSLSCQITDVECTPNKSMGLWEIKSDNLNWCDDSDCRLDINLSEYTPIGNCLKNTLITDNHRGWFPENGIPSDNTDPITGLPVADYIHPAFRYCIDIKPQFLQNFVFVIAQTLSFAFGALIVIIQAVLDFIDWVITQLGGTFTGDDNFADFVNEKLGDLFDALLGCNRKHPSPLIRNYFINACSKCGVTFESNIFNDPDSQYYDACLLFAPNRVGYIEEDVDTDKKDWIPSNKPNETALTLASSLKDIFNAKYKLENGVFSFHRRDEFPLTTVFDFTGADKDLLLEPLCYGWNAAKKPASITLDFAQDVKDVAGDEALHRYSGAKDWATNNPFYEGITAIKTDLYAAARFTTDGIDRKLIFVKLDNQPFWEADILLIEKGVTQLYKILIWDSENSDPNEAKVVKKHSNNDYNIHWEDEWIYGNPTPEDYYVYNYPMLFDPSTNDGVYNGVPLPSAKIHSNLYAFHKIDDPTNTGVQNKSWNAVLELCCTTLNLLIEDDSSQDGLMCHLDYLVELSNGEKGTITRVEVDYDKAEIRLSGEIRYVV